VAISWKKMLGKSQKKISFAGKNSPAHYFLIEAIIIVFFVCFLFIENII
jgi:hypothetical protein